MAREASLRAFRGFRERKKISVRDKNREAIKILREFRAFREIKYFP